MDEWGLDFASRVRWARRLRGMTQQQLADAIVRLGGQVSRPAIALWEKGDSKSAEGRNLLLAAQVLDVSKLWLDKGKGGPYDRINTDNPTRQRLIDLVETLTDEDVALVMPVVLRLLGRSDEPSAHKPASRQAAMSKEIFTRQPAAEKMNPPGKEGEKKQA